MKKEFSIFLILIILIIIIHFFLPTVTEKKVDIEIVIPNLDTPWGMGFLPDDSLIFTERKGNVFLYKNNRKILLSQINVSEVSESGLSGIAIDPEFSENNFIYLYYTHKTANRLSRFNLSDNRLINEEILLDGIPSARFHDGGRIKFGPDGKLYVTTGDATSPNSSQDLNSLSGKILRLNKDGSIPLDNPFNNYVYSFGHRNPQGIDWSQHNILYSTEHGQVKNDEVNIIKSGKNYGWPDTECFSFNPKYTSALRCFSNFTLAPSANAFHNDDLYITGLRGKQLRKLSIINNQIIKEEVILNNLGRLRNVVSHKGYIYIATSNRDGRGIPKTNDDKIIRFKPI